MESCRTVRKNVFVDFRRFIENEMLERIADVIGCQVRDILRPDYEGYSENIIEWKKDAPKAILSLSQRGMIAKIKRLAERRPDECQILAENKDGSGLQVFFLSFNCQTPELPDECRKPRR